MPKISRPIVYTALAALAAYALFLNTQPATPTVRHVSRTNHTLQATDPNGILPEDLRAHFPRYAGGKRDPFVPGVALARRNMVVASADRTQIGWALTGISTVNGVASALLENSATGENVFLQPGDRWNGLRVVSIRSDRVLFLNGLGREDILTFAAPPDDKASGVPVPTVPSLPGSNLSQIPYAVSRQQVTPLSAGSVSLPVLPPLSGSNAPSLPDDNAPPQDDNAPPNDFPFPPGPPSGQ